MVYVFVYSVVKCVGVQPIARIVQPIIRSSRFCSGVLKIQRIEEFPWGLKGTVSSEKYILQPRAHNSILPMSVDTLPLTLHVMNQSGYTTCDESPSQQGCIAVITCVHDIEFYDVHSFIGHPGQSSLCPAVDPRCFVPPVRLSSTWRTCAAM